MLRRYRRHFPLCVRPARYQRSFLASLHPSVALPLRTARAFAGVFALGMVGMAAWGWR